MISKNNIKHQLYETCQQNIKDRINVIHQKLAGIEESRNNETKSSAGDKYETGRAMMQIEADNANRQLAQAKEVQNKLNQIKPDKTSETIEAGSFIRTNKGSYYIAIGLGKIKLNDKTYFCISTDAPIAKVMLGKKAGDQISFNGNTINIQEVI